MAVQRVLMVSPEFYGYAMAGGLAMAVTGLSKALVKQGVDVRVAIPKYADLKEQQSTEIILHLVPGDIQILGTYEDIAESIKSSTYKRDNPTAYVASREFSRRVNSLVEYLVTHKEWVPDVIHVHEWQSAAAVHLLKKGELSKIPIVLTTHNAGYIGKVPNFLDSGIKKPITDEVTAISSDGQLFTSLLELGVYYADACTTVSPSYATEILNQGTQVDTALRRRIIEKGIEGILNGIDIELFDPKTDKLVFRYDTNDLESLAYGKGMNKVRLHKQFGVESLSEPFQIAMMARLAEQKGIDLLIQAVDKLKGLKETHLMIVGEPENWNVRHKLEALGGNIKVYPEFAEQKLQHLILAGSDAVLMPSRYEPCGYVQLEGTRYGTLPITTHVGGLRDTVIPIDKNGGYGFIIKENTPEGIVNAVIEARNAFRNKERWRAAIKNAVNEDFSWSGPRNSVGKYIDLYNRLLPKS